jgi:hypothetical protein
VPIGRTEKEAEMIGKSRSSHITDVTGWRGGKGDHKSAREIKYSMNMSSAYLKQLSMMLKHKEMMIIIIIIIMK